MKKILSIVLALILAMSLSVAVFAEWEDELVLREDNLGSNKNAVNAEVGLASTEGAVQFDVLLPEELPLGETAKIHIKGTSVGDFRVWISSGPMRFSDLYKASDEGFFGGEFDIVLEVLLNDADGTGSATGNSLTFKGPSSSTPLDQLNVTYAAVVHEGDKPAEEPEAPAEEEAPAEDNTSAEDTSADEEAPAETGIVMAILPAALAAVAFAASKKR